MNCHGHDTRVRIVENYNIKCTAHIRLLNGQIRSGPMSRFSTS